MKRLLSITVAAIVLVALAATPALASHGSRRGFVQAASYSACDTKSCTQAGLHYHGGNAYAGHYYGDGHDYHPYCDVEGCVIAGYHEHNGTYCFGHSFNDGHDYHGYCGVQNCALAGYHEHNGVYCFGHTANDGHGYHHAGRGHH